MTERIPEKHLEFLKTLAYYSLVRDGLIAAHKELEVDFSEDDVMTTITEFYNSIKTTLETVDKNPYKYLKSESESINKYANWLIKNS